MKILLISGHGNGDPGACAKINGTQYKEAEETIKMVELMIPMLSPYCDVDVYPTSRNCYKDVQNGCVQVNFADYDYVLEIHFNAGVTDLNGNGRSTGTEIYVTKSDGTTAVEQSIVNALAGLGFKNRGVKKYNWSVINKAYKASAQSALLEVCFIDDADDMKIYLADRTRIAQTIVNALISSFSLKSNSSASTTQTSSNVANSTSTAYQVGTQKDCPILVKPLEDLNIRKTAGGFVAVANGAKKGVSYTITQVSGTWGKLKSGAGWISISSKYVKRV